MKEDTTMSAVLRSKGLKLPLKGAVVFNGENPFRKDSKRWKRLERAKNGRENTVEAIRALPDMKSGTIVRWWLRGLITINGVGLWRAR
jgi:hypothetical protein